MGLLRKESKDLVGEKNLQSSRNEEGFYILKGVHQKRGKGGGKKEDLGKILLTVQEQVNKKETEGVGADRGTP